MRILNDHFEWVAPPRISEVVHPKFGAVSRKDLTEAQALKLWQAGFPHLAITPEGRKALLQEKVPAKAGTPRPAESIAATEAKMDGVPGEGVQLNDDLPPVRTAQAPEDRQERLKRRAGSSNRSSGSSASARAADDTPEREGAAE